MSSDLANDDFPLDIYREIFFRLPAKSLFRFRAVCKWWRTLIDDSSSNTLVIIIKPSSGPPFDDPIHTFDLDALNLFTDDGVDQTISGSTLDLIYNQSSTYQWRLPVSACNGLMLVYPNPPKSPFEIWNLSTHERLELPPIENNHPGPQFIGLGYDHASQDFKAVSMHRQQTHIYSLRSDTWRTIGVCLFGSDDLSAHQYGGVFLCGALHWLLFHGSKILALDLGTEKHRHIQMNPLPKELKYMYIDVLDGRLAVSGYSRTHFDVWVMKDYGSDDESWIKLFSIERVHVPGTYECLRPIAYMKDDKNQVFLKFGGCGFFLFDMKSETIKKVRIHGVTENLYAQIIPRSFFTLRHHCGAGSGASRIKPLCRPRKMIKVSLAIRVTQNKE